MVVMNAENVASEDDIQGQQRPLPGLYHAIVKEAIEREIRGADKVIVEFEVLAGTTPGQEGRVLTEYFAVTERAMPRLTRLALVLGLLQPGAGDTDVDFAQGVGRQLVIEVEENEYEDKDGKARKGVRLGFLGMWSVGHEAVAHVPKNEQAMQMVPSANGGKTANGDKTAAPPSQKDEWADL